MDHSICGYLSRRSKAELEQIIALYRHLRDDDYYKSVLDLAMHYLQKRIAEEGK